MEEFQLDTEMDINGLPEILINDVELLEGDEGLTAFDFIISLSSASEEIVTVDFTTVSETASDRQTFIGSVDVILQDYNPIFGSVEFAPGEIEQNITVDVIGDTNADRDAETFLVNLSNPENATLADDSGTGTIINDELLTDGDTIYRFFNSDTGSHFYTADESEKDFVQGNLDNYNFEGAAFISAPSLSNSALVADVEGGIEPVYRFFNNTTGTHLYTMSEEERSFITDSLPEYNDEGIAYFAYQDEIRGTTPLYRFFNEDTGTHFYTPSAAERDFVTENLDSFRLEGDNGVAFYVQPIADI